MNTLYTFINRVIEFMLIFIFGLLVLDVIWQVLSRYLIGQSSSFTEEFARFALIWLSILGAAYLNGQRAHLAIDFWLKKLPPAKQRQRMLTIEGMMLGFALIIMVIGGGNLVYLTLSLGQRSSVLNIPLGLVYAIVPFSGLLIIFYSIYHIFQEQQLASKV